MRLHEPTLYIGAVIVYVTAVIWPESSSHLQGFSVLVWLGIATRNDNPVLTEVNDDTE